MTNQLWWSGPDFLQENPDSWPDMPTRYGFDVAQVELAKSPPVVVHSLVSASSSSNEQSNLNLEAVIDLTRHGSKRRLLRITGLVLKFLVLLKSKSNDQSMSLKGDDLIVAVFSSVPPHLATFLRYCTLLSRQPKTEFEALLSAYPEIV